MHSIPTKEWLLDEDERETTTINKPVIQGYIYDLPIKMLVDSGSEISIISQELFDTLKHKYSLPTLPVSGVSIIGITGVKNQQIRIETMIPIKLNNTTIFQTLLIISKVNVDLLLGIDWLCKYEVTINFKQSEVTGATKDYMFCLPFVTTESRDNNRA